MRPFVVLTLSSIVVASPCVSAAAAAKIEISISSAGAIVLGGRTVTVSELEHDLAGYAAAKAKPDLLIVASEKAPYQVLSAVMEVCRKSGFTKFSLQSR